MNSDMDLEKLRFSQRQRLSYLESVAYWEGSVARPRITTAFKVSDNHVTKDFRLYKTAFPGNLHYDEVARVYRPGRSFRPRFGKGSPDEYLALLRSDAEQRDGSLWPATSNVLTDTVPLPKGTLDAKILNAVTRAISAGHGLDISYQSKNRDEPANRRIWPHALAFSGTRWHARVYDSEREHFIDLVLQRILSTKTRDEPSPCPVDQDLGWNTWVDVEVIPRRSFSASQAKAVAREFGMVQVARTWVWKARLRECLVNYFLYLHRLDLPLELDPQRVIELRDSKLVDRYFGDRSRGLLTKSAKATG
jgi:hypothetical protein